MKFLLIALLASGVVPVLGCKSSQQVQPREVVNKSLKEFLSRYEPTFNPSEYDDEVSMLRQVQRNHSAPLQAINPFTSAVPETIPGFRVQVLFTQDIDAANQMKDNVESALPENWVYVVYESPYYKVRVGNYTERASAVPMIKKLRSLGYKDAWVVPDNVVSNLPPKPPVIDVEPENQLHRR
jgi:hypothetical protein